MEVIFLLLRSLFPHESTIPYDFKVSTHWLAFLVQVTEALLIEINSTKSNVAFIGEGMKGVFREKPL